MLRAATEVELSSPKDEVKDFDLALEHLRTFPEFEDCEQDLEAVGLNFVVE